jgi:hypothetical protein
VNKFERDDKIIRISNGTKNCPIGHKSKVSRFYCYKDANSLNGNIIDDVHWDLVTALKYENPPLAHCDLRIEHARGANIEVLFAVGDGFAVGEEWVTDLYPAWHVNSRYRVMSVERKELTDLVMIKVKKYQDRIRSLKLSLLEMENKESKINGE